MFCRYPAEIVACYDKPKKRIQNTNAAKNKRRIRKLVEVLLKETVDSAARRDMFDSLTNDKRQWITSASEFALNSSFILWTGANV